MHRRIFLCLLLMASLGCWAQRAAVSTNALYWLTATPNAGIQFRTSRLCSMQVDVMGRYKPSVAGNSLQFVGFAPELRFWPEQVGLQHFYIGAMAQTAIYNAHWANGDSHKGGLVAFGPTFGYNWALSPHWNIELSTGVGCIWLRDRKNSNRHHDTTLYPGPLKVGVNFIYFIK